MVSYLAFLFSLERFYIVHFNKKGGIVVNKKSLGLIVCTLILAACPEERGERLFLRITADKTGHEINTLKVLLRGEKDGKAVRVPGDFQDSDFSRALGYLDPSRKALLVEVDYDGDSFSSSAVTTHILGYADAMPVASYTGMIDLSSRGIVSVHMRKLTTECDADADGFPDCSVKGCCAPQYKDAINDCEPEDVRSFPWNARELCDEVDNDCDTQTDEGIVGIGNACENDGVGACRSVGTLVCTGETEPVCNAENTNDLPCDDGNACTENDRCWFGGCAAGALVLCNDKDVCTGIELCDKNNGCLLVKPALDCNDGLACTIDSCDPAEGCVYKPDPECTCEIDDDCDDGSVCTTEQCNHETGLCVFENVPGDCDDKSACTVEDACVDGACEGTDVDCSDGNVCTFDSCDSSGGCVYENNSLPCNDGDACTITDLCQDGECKSGLPLSCDDENPCTDDSCDSSSGCIYNNNTIGCDDGDACTDLDACVDGTCEGTAIVCDDGNVCTFDSCDSSGGCVYTNNTIECDDEDACTTGDTCSDGSCTGGSLLSCDDENPCTDDSCDSSSGCIYNNNTIGCDDGDACTDLDACVDGACEGADVDCDDGNGCTFDSCDPKSGCVSVGNTIGCNDGNACTTGDACLNGSCTGGSLLSCDDENPCTDDSCDSSSGCIYINNTIGCDDGDACTDLDACVDGACEGTAIVCDDGNVCTFDSCDSSSGSCTNTLMASCGITIPAGSFMNTPSTNAYIPEFTIQATEVTVAEYGECVTAGVCTAPDTAQDCNWGIMGREDHPINCVSRIQADTYCTAWMEGELPSEYQWMKAARGGCELFGDATCVEADDYRIYPSGNTSPNCVSAVLKNDSGDGCGMFHTWPVGSKPDGSSPYGLLDMTGNLWEMTSATCQENNETLICGGGWRTPDFSVTQINGCYCVGGSIASSPGGNRDIGLRCRVPSP